MTDIARFSASVAAVLPAIGTPGFSAALIAALRALARVDEATVIVYKNGVQPSIDFAMPDSWKQPNLDIFMKGAFLLDPYYLAASRDRHRGFFRLRELAPNAFRQSEYYKIYYGASGLRDECGYLISLDEDSFANIALGLTSQRAFARATLKLFADAAPLITALCHEHWNGTHPARESDSDLRTSLESALATFGSSKLTNRECEVIHMILQGHTTKKVADELNIAYETVKLHRKHAYAKLGINTQAELFYTFIDSLMHAEAYRGGDPLREYRQLAR
jgi:DNA-binding CsgD family transcriptional regulator